MCTSLTVKQYTEFIKWKKEAQDFAREENLDMGLKNSNLIPVFKELIFKRDERTEAFKFFSYFTDYFYRPGSNKISDENESKNNCLMGGNMLKFTCNCFHSWIPESSTVTSMVKNCPMEFSVCGKYKSLILPTRRSVLVDMLIPIEQIIAINFVQGLVVSNEIVFPVEEYEYLNRALNQLILESEYHRRNLLYI